MKDTASIKETQMIYKYLCKLCGEILEYYSSISPDIYIEKEVIHDSGNTGNVLSAGACTGTDTGTGTDNVTITSNITN